MTEFTVITTPEQELIVFLLDVIGIPKGDVHLVQQGGAVSVTTRRDPEEFILIMGDKEQAGLWHVVGSTGFRGFVTGTYSLLHLLHSHGVDPLYDTVAWHIVENRYAKARRLINHFDDSGFDVQTDDEWRHLAKVFGENPPSDATLAIIKQLLKENP